MHSNKYIIIYASILVVLVASVLSVASLQLKPFQDKNVRLEKMQNILGSVAITTSREDAEKAYDKYIVEEVVIDQSGSVVGNNAFNIDLVNEYKKEPANRQLPLFICKLDDNKRYIIIPVRGKGLWGPIWGFISLKEDYNTVYGATFDHKTETPGLGAEINEKSFQDQFAGKQIFDDKGEFTSIRVLKGGADPANLHGVDAISGGTITSNGVDAMLKSGIGSYLGYIQKQKISLQ
jgi:Na+-transporting NADH:ubiquinone oxidoreductase subunit C